MINIKDIKPALLLPILLLLAVLLSSSVAGKTVTGKTIAGKTASDFYREAQQADSLNDFLLTEKHVKNSIKIDPRYYPSWSLFAKNQRDLGNYDNAITAYKKAIALAPSGKQWAESVAGYSDTLFLLGDHHSALYAMHRASLNDLAPKNIVAMYKILKSQIDKRYVNRGFQRLPSTTNVSANASVSNKDNIGKDYVSKNNISKKNVSKDNASKDNVNKDSANKGGVNQDRVNQGRVNQDNADKHYSQKKFIAHIENLVETVGGDIYEAFHFLTKHHYYRYGRLYAKDYEKYFNDILHIKKTLASDNTLFDHKGLLDAIAQLVKNFQHDGETLRQTASRVEYVNRIVGPVGLKERTVVSSQYYQALADAAGGVDQLEKMIQAYQEHKRFCAKRMGNNFSLSKLRKTVEKQFDNLGLDLNKFKTSQGYRDYFEKNKHRFSTDEFMLSLQAYQAIDLLYSQEEQMLSIIQKKAELLDSLEKMLNPLRSETDVKKTAAKTEKRLELEKATHADPLKIEQVMDQHQDVQNQFNQLNKKLEMLVKSVKQ